MSSVFTPRSRSTAYSSSPKSSPTGPTTRTSVKKLAAREKWTAEPPSIRSRSPKGVLTASKAIDPTTSRLIGRGSLTCGGHARTSARHRWALAPLQGLLRPAQVDQGPAGLAGQRAPRHGQPDPAGGGGSPAARGGPLLRPRGGRVPRRSLRRLPRRPAAGARRARAPVGGLGGVLRGVRLAGRADRLARGRRRAARARASRGGRGWPRPAHDGRPRHVP